MDFKDLLGSESDNILDMKKKCRIDRKREAMEETAEDSFFFEDFSENAGQDDLDETFVKQENSRAGFNLLEYGLPIVNGNEGFSYNQSYRIPYERYLEVFGPSFTFHMYLQHAMGSWGGNCFGMAAVSILTYLGKINLGVYQEEGLPLADTAYDRIVTADFGAYCCLKQNSELTKLIERYFLLQFSAHVFELRYKAEGITRKEPERIQNFFHSVYQDRIPYMVLIFWNMEGTMVGHALVVDSIRTPEELGGGWHRIYLYDPNNPCHTFSGQRPAYYYRQAANRCVDVNVVTGEWHMNAQINAEGTADSGSDHIGSDTANASINFINCESFQNNFVEKARVHPSCMNFQQMLRYSAGCVEVSDLNGNRLCRVVNGVLTECADKRICNFPVIGTDVGSSQGRSCGTLVLPEQAVSVKLDKGFAGMFLSDRYMGCVSEDTVMVRFTEDGSMELSAEVPTQVNVVVQEENDGKFISYMTDINVSGANCRIALQDGALYLNTDNNRKMDVEIITEAGRSEVKNMSAEHGILVGRQDSYGMRKKQDQELSK
ncbi:MAG: hypothetical protein PUG60_07305 [Lachnospiraceae bacterium]|nr:hypothetical protein [Lachnospiraceae bacterium]MDY4970441.1 hypothetical protein [Lachnospiraceae bacterium]